MHESSGAVGPAREVLALAAAERDALDRASGTEGELTKTILRASPSVTSSIGTSVEHPTRAQATVLRDASFTRRLSAC